jgi:hypothetical protein
MPDRDESTPDPDDLPPAEPQVTDPDDYDDTQGFRETMLLYITEPAFNAALRVVGTILYDMALDYCRHWPKLPGKSTVWEMEAALADLRHLQGFLGMVAREREEVSGSTTDHDLSALAEREMTTLQEIGDRIQQALVGKV